MGNLCVPAGWPALDGWEARFSKFENLIQRLLCIMGSGSICR